MKEILDVDLQKPTTGAVYSRGKDRFRFRMIGEACSMGSGVTKNIIGNPALNAQKGLFRDVYFAILCPTRHLLSKKYPLVMACHSTYHLIQVIKWRISKDTQMSQC
jgi:hypothetical protein